MIRAFLSSLLIAGVAQAAPEPFDVVVYGGNAGGIAAAVQASRMGKRVVVIEPSSRIGGMATSGLGATDIGARSTIGGIAREFYGRIYTHYQQPGAWVSETRAEYVPKHPDNITESMKVHWFVEPKVAHRTFEALLAESKATLVLNDRLLLDGGVTKQGNRIVSIKTEGGREFAGRVFIDCSYEGDLMAKAGVAYTVGREANAQYGETLNGIRAMGGDKSFGVDPFIKPGDPSSGTVYGVDAGAPGTDGDADKRVQAYTFRLCLTDVPENRVPIAKPADYDATKYELVLRFVTKNPQAKPGTSLFKLTPLPNRKTDSNNLNSFSTDVVNFAHGWAEATHAERDVMWRQHKSFVQGFLYFLANDPRVPSEVRERVLPWGLAKDEFTDTENWPPQLYVREARRMVGQYVVTEQDCEGARRTDDAVGIASYPMDSHQVSRFADAAGKLRLEGAFFKKVPPYGVSYRALTPKAEECGNLLVPVCLSASHAAYGSIRMEPVFMILSQSAATAAAMAIDADADVQAIDVAKLRDRLARDGQILAAPKAK